MHKEHIWARAGFTEGTQKCWKLATVLISLEEMLHLASFHKGFCL